MSTSRIGKVGASPLSQQFSVTSLGKNPADDRRYRMRFYFLAMSLRFLCVLSLFWVRGWWVILPLLGAVLLPYFGVMIANAIAANNENAHTQGVTPLSLKGSSPSDETREPALIVVDAPAERRRTTTAHSADAESETASDSREEELP